MTQLNHENLRRIQIARQAIHTMPERDTLETDIIDLITNLLHLAESSELDAEAIVRMAVGHFEAEAGE